MFKLFQRKFSSKIQLLSREPFKLTLPEFRSDKNLCSMASRVTGNTDFRLMLQVLYNSSPAWDVMINAKPDERMVKQAQIEGYTMALANLESMSKHEAIIKSHVEETYEPPTDEPTQ